MAKETSKGVYSKQLQRHKLRATMTKKRDKDTSSCPKFQTQRPGNFQHLEILRSAWLTMSVDTEYIWQFFSHAEDLFSAFFAKLQVVGSYLSISILTPIFINQRFYLIETLIRPWPLKTPEPTNPVTEQPDQCHPE